jgi:hypothetical protein
MTGTALPSPKYQLEILDLSLNKIAEVINPFPLDGAGTIFRFSKELSDFGQCTFRVSAFDQLLTQYGDVFKPHQYHLRIRRNGKIVWQGAIIENAKRTKDYIEVVAAEYEFYLNKILVKRSSVNPGTGSADNVFRIFNSGSMGTAVTNMINESLAVWKTGTNANSILANMTVGTIENPNFPPNMTNSTGAAISGAWSFSTNLQLTYDFQSVYYILKSFGVYAYADFYIDNDLTFNFKKFVGNDHHYDVNFTFNKQAGQPSLSNITDYNLPRLGQRMVNNLWGIAADTSGTILDDPETDQTSVSEYGLLEGVAAYSDVKDKNILKARTTAELPLVSTPDPTNAIVMLDETVAYPLGVWDIGDLVTINIQNTGVSLKDTRRIVGVTVAVNGTGRESTTVQTNKPLPWQYKAS